MEYGGVFRALRQKKGWNQEEMADKLHINQSDVSRFENDKALPDLPLFQQIIQVTQAPEVLVAFMLGMDGITIMQNLSQFIGGMIIWI